jgi:hypothetical protein
MTDLIGLPAISNPNARILILGSMPGVESLQQQQYYAHPRNQFWSILSTVLQADTPLTDLSYADKKSYLLTHGIALWDVIAQCQREGSLDSSILFESITPNAFADFFAEHLQLQAIFFNGRKAEQIFMNLVYPELSYEVQQLCFKTLPSTSPAHASLRFAQKTHEWSAIQNLLAAPLSQELPA